MTKHYKITSTPFSFTCPVSVLAQAVTMVCRSGKAIKISLSITDGKCIIATSNSSAEINVSSKGTGHIEVNKAYFNDIMKTYKNRELEIQVTNEFILIDKICIKVDSISFW